MKTILLLCGSTLLLYSCVEASKSDLEELISDDEMKDRVEVEEIEFDTEDPLKDSMNAEDSSNAENDNSSSPLGKIENEVPREFPLPEYPEDENHTEIPERPTPSCCLGCPPESRGETGKYGEYHFPEIEAQYPGGVQEMKAFIVSNLKYPDPIGCYEGRVYVTFIIEKDGCLTHAEVMRGGISKELNEEALRVVRAMPNWIPAKHKGKIVAARARLPISFTLN